MKTFNKVTNLRDVWVLEPKKYFDERGYFQEIFNSIEFYEYTKIPFHPVQENESCSKYGVMRGLHFQFAPYEQAKLVKCMKGKILDVIVDIMPESPTFKEIFGVILSEKNNKQLFVPKGFAHGFVALEDNSIIRYLTDNEYVPSSDSGYYFTLEILKKGLFNAVGCDLTLEDAKTIFDKLCNNNSLVLSVKDSNLCDFVF